MIKKSWELVCLCTDLLKCSDVKQNNASFKYTISIKKKQSRYRK